MLAHHTSLVDVSAWTGTWPFDLNGPVSLESLADRLARAGIVEALVSPLAAVLAPDPMPANWALVSECEAARDSPVTFHPVPIINPMLATWRTDLGSLIASSPGVIKAVRLLPDWHGWGPGLPDATACLRVISDHGLVPIIQTRMIDERAMPVAAAPARLEVDALVTWLRMSPQIPTVLGGVYRNELPQLADLEHVAVDVALVESGDTLATLMEVLSPERVLLGTHAPLLEPLSAVVKLPVAGPHAAAAYQIGSETAKARFKLGPT